MAIVKDPLFLKWRSTHSGITGYAERGRAAMRLHSTPRPKKTSASHKYDRALNSTVTLWRLLTVEEQNAWNDFASANPKIDRYGNALYWSGFNWFIALSGVHSWLAGSAITIPPENADPGYAPQITILGGSGVLPILLYANPEPDSGQYISVSRKINFPYSVVSPPNVLDEYLLIDSSFSFPVIVSPVGEFLTNIYHHFFRISCYDSFGRQPEKETFLVST